MTNKDTERLVQMHMQQTIPDRAALWERIESNLPEQPAFPEIRKTSSRTGMVYRVMGAAACFLLIVGGIGVFTAMNGFRKSDQVMYNTAEPAKTAADAPRYENEEAPADAACEAEYAAKEADGAPADAAIQEKRNTTVSFQGLDNSKQNITAHYAEAEAAANADRQEECMEDAGGTVLLSGYVCGEVVTVSADASILAEAEEILQGAPDTLVKNPPMTEEARENGLLLTFELNGREIILTCVDGSCQMVADGNAYYAPEQFRKIAEDMELN